ncbi:unnamed protein product, partial [Ectocarpus sp. 13 AM-2016]
QDKRAESTTLVITSALPMAEGDAVVRTANKTYSRSLALRLQGKKQERPKRKPMLPNTRWCSTIRPTIREHHLLSSQKSTGATQDNTPTQRPYRTPPYPELTLALRINYSPKQTTSLRRYRALPYATLRTETN